MTVRTSDDRETVQPRDRADWRKWLEENSDRSDSIWLVLFKKGVRRNRLSLDEAVEEALAFGWIDSKINRVDDKRFKIIMSPRRPESIWSKINKRRVEALIGSGRMTTAGMIKVEAAKRDGSWDLLDGVESLKVPPDLMDRFELDPDAKRGFESMSASHKAQYLLWVAQAKRPETRAKRIEETVLKMREKASKATKK